MHILSRLIASITYRSHRLLWGRHILSRVADCAFYIGGGFGDHLIAARYIRDLHAHVGGFTFDTYSSHPHIAEWIFKNTPGYQNSYGNRFTWPMIIGRYIVRIIVTDYVANAGVVFAPWELKKNIRKLLRVIDSMEMARQDIKNLDQFINNHPFMDNFHAQTAVTMGHKRHNFVHSLSGLKYSGDLLQLDYSTDVQSKFNLPSQPYITIADAFEYSTHTKRMGRVYCTKSYPLYENLIALIKRRFPAVSIVQVGKDVSGPMRGADLVLLNKTNLCELAGVLKGSSLHIDNESGIVHLATSLGVKCCVIFGPTSFEYFSYDKNINIAPTFCGNCYWIKEDWMSSCPRGYGQARCMTEQRPEDILDRIIPVLNKLSKTHTVAS